MKKILILAPHQDDELILCGSFLKEMSELNDVYIVFLTNGDYDISVKKIRLQEALCVGRLYKIKEDNIIFLGYANEYDANGPHIYNAGSNEVVSSQYGNHYTYGLPEHPEYCYQKYGKHRLYTRENIKFDLKDVLCDIMPDVIFATDLEIHPDHKANSLLLDEVLGEILKENIGYQPIVLKKPGYTTSWFSPKDYSKYNNTYSKLTHIDVRVNGHKSQFDNPYIRWDKRVRLPIGKSVNCNDKQKNILYKALQLYSSQNAIEHYEMMNNSDVVFWQRRTDSLTFESAITVSSGRVDYINDFKIVDASAIKRINTDSLVIDKGIWRPEDNDTNPFIYFEFKREECISEIKIYQEFYPKSKILKCHLQFDDGSIFNIQKINYYGSTQVIFSPIKTRTVKFIIDEVSDRNFTPGISEIEIFRYKDKNLMFSKLMIYDNFVYDYYTEKEFVLPLSVYEYWDDGSTNRTTLENYNIILEIKDKKKNAVNLNGSYIQGRIIDKIRLKIVSKINNSVEDTIELVPYNVKMKKINPVYESKKEELISKAADRIAQLSYGEYRKGMEWYVREFIRGYACEDYKLKKRNQKKIYFIGTPDHYNIGDHAITLATYRILHDVMGDYEIEEIPIMNFARSFPRLLHNIKPDDLIVLQGGGNMGNIYWRNERIRREVIAHFPNNLKMIFPETIYYDETVEGQRDFNISKKLYASDKIVIFAREKKSYDIMRKAYPRSQVYLIPDSVCYLAPYNLGTVRKNVGLCYRSDLEEGITAYEKNEINNVIEKTGYMSVLFDMMYLSKGYIGKANRKLIVERKIREIASFKYVITDRLHGMILCYITGTPCIVISKYNHKISSFYETWLWDVPYIRYIDQLGNIEEEIKYISGLSGCVPKKMDFTKLKEIMEEWK